MRSPWGASRNLSAHAPPTWPPPRPLPPETPSFSLTASKAGGWGLPPPPAAGLRLREGGARAGLCLGGRVAGEPCLPGAGMSLDRPGPPSAQACLQVGPSGGRGHREEGRRACLCSSPESEATVHGPRAWRGSRLGCNMEPLGVCGVRVALAGDGGAGRAPLYPLRPPHPRRCTRPPGPQRGRGGGRAGPEIGVINVTRLLGWGWG